MMAVYWLLGAAVLFVIEMITVSLTSIWFAGGAIVAAIAAFLGLPLIGQLILFAAVSLLLLILTRPMAKKLIDNHLEKTNADSYVGQKYRVTETIDPAENRGMIRIGDVEWKAVPADGISRIREDTIVVICKIKGNKLVVAEDTQTGIETEAEAADVEDEIVDAEVVGEVEVEEEASEAYDEDLVYEADEEDAEDGAEEIIEENEHATKFEEE